MRLGDRDKKILFELSNNANVTSVNLAKKLKISKEAAFKRVKNLEDKGIIQEYYTGINLEKIGIMLFKLHVKLTKPTPKSRKKLFEYLLKHKKVVVCTDCKDYYDSEIEVKVKNNLEFDDFLQQLRRDLGTQVEVAKTKIPVYEINYPRNYFAKGKEIVKEVKSSEVETIDEIGIKILECICTKPRYKLLHIAQKVNISPNSVRARIKAMEETGIITGSGTIIDFEKIDMQVFKLEIKLNDIEDLANLEEFVANNPYTQYYLRCVDDFDAEIKVECNDYKHFVEILEEIKASLNYEIKKIRQYPEHRLLKVKFM